MARRPLHFCFSAILTILFPIISISSTSAQISVSVLDAKITQRYSDIHPDATLIYWPMVQVHLNIGHICLVTQPMFAQGTQDFIIGGDIACAKRIMCHTPPGPPQTWSLSGLKVSISSCISLAVTDKHLEIESGVLSSIQEKEERSLLDKSKIADPSLPSIAVIDDGAHLASILTHPSLLNIPLRAVKEPNFFRVSSVNAILPNDVTICIFPPGVQEPPVEDESCGIDYFDYPKDPATLNPQELRDVFWATVGKAIISITKQDFKLVRDPESDKITYPKIGRRIRNEFGGKGDGIVVMSRVQLCLLIGSVLFCLYGVYKCVKLKLGKKPDFREKYRKRKGKKNR